METTRVREMVFVKADGTEIESIPDAFHVVVRLEHRKAGKGLAIELTGAHFRFIGPPKDWSEYKSAHV